MESLKRIKKYHQDPIFYDELSRQVIHVSGFVKCFINTGLLNDRQTFYYIHLTFFVVRIT